MKAFTPAGIAALIVAASLPALANTSATTSTNDKGMDRATAARSENANVTTGQSFQDKHANALDANTTDTKKMVKKKAKKAKQVAEGDISSSQVSR